MKIRKSIILIYKVPSAETEGTKQDTPIKMPMAVAKLSISFLFI